MTREAASNPSSARRSAPPRSFERRVWDGGDVTPELLARAHEILQASFERWPGFDVGVSPVEHLRWKLEQPGWAPASLVGEMVDGVMAGVTLRLHRRFRVGGIVREARDWVDQCLHPDHRESGIYGRLAATWPTQRLDYDFGVWSTRHAKVVAATRASEPGHLELGGRMRAWLLPLGSADALAARADEGMPAWKRAVLSRAAVEVSRWRRGRPSSASPRRPPGEPSIRAIDRFDDSVVPLIEGSSRDFELVQDRSVAFLCWRYCDPRGGRFIVLAAEDAGEVVGFAALKVADGVGYVMDLLTLPSCGAEHALLEAAIDALRQAGCDAVVCRLPARHPLSDLLPRRGFVDARSSMGYALASGRLPLTALGFLAESDARLHLMLGDVDWA